MVRITFEKALWIYVNSLDNAALFLLSDLPKRWVKKLNHTSVDERTSRQCNL